MLSPLGIVKNEHDVIVILINIFSLFFLQAPVVIGKQRLRSFFLLLERRLIIGMARNYNDDEPISLCNK